MWQQISWLMQTRAEVPVADDGEILGVNRSRTGNTARIMSADMTRVAKIVMAAIGLQVAVVAAQAQRESGARPAFEAATIKLSTGPLRANIVTQPSPTRYSIPGM